MAADHEDVTAELPTVSVSYLHLTAMLPNAAVVPVQPPAVLATWPATPAFLVLNVHMLHDADAQHPETNRHYTNHLQLPYTDNAKCAVQLTKCCTVIINL